MGVIGGGEDDGAGMSAVLLLEHSARGRFGGVGRDQRVS
jgi:hypothetical protein